MLCSILLHQARFLSHGCPNCEQYLGLANSMEAIEECTSQTYEGVIALLNPTDSWVARWNRLSNYVPGSYAMTITGVVSPITLA